MPKDVRRHKTIRTALRRTATQRKVRLTSVKDLLAKAGLSEKQIAQTHDSKDKICLEVQKLVGPKWASAVMAVNLKDGVLNVSTGTAAFAARLRLILESALTAGELVLAEVATPRSIRVRVAR